MERIDPTDIATINRHVTEWSASGDQIQPVQIIRIVIEDNAIDTLVDELRVLAAGKRIILVVDHTPMRRGGDDLKPLIEDALRSICTPVVCTLPNESTDRFHADLETAQRLADELGGPGGGFAAIVSIGSGSITDVAKYARHLYVKESGRRIPFVCFPTAASVTAYTSALAVLTIAGAKRTLPAAAPDSVICDLCTIAAAPPAMTQAGFGDVLARGVSYGDWFLANQLGMDDGFSVVPGKLLEYAERKLLDQAAEVAAGRPDAIRAVMDALLLSGMAMSIARQTAPLSGWEHAISHFLDLTAQADGREPALHGGQVGIATLISARAYEWSWNECDLERLTNDRDIVFYRGLLEETFKRVPSGKALVPELWREFSKKVARWHSAIDVRRSFIIRKRAGEFDEFISKSVRSAAEIDNALRQAGAPRRWRDLDEPIAEHSVIAAVSHAHLVRARFTYGDFLTETDWLNTRQTDKLLTDLIP